MFRRFIVHLKYMQPRLALGILVVLLVALVAMFIYGTVNNKVRPRARIKGIVGNMPHRKFQGGLQKGPSGGMVGAMRRLPKQSANQDSPLGMGPNPKMGGKFNLNFQGESRELRKGKARKQPNGQGQRQLNGQGQRQPNGQGQGQLNGQGQRQPNGKGQRQLNGKGQRQLNGKGQRQLNGKGQRQPNGKGQRQPNGQGQRQPNGKGQRQLNGKGQRQLNGKGQRQQNGKGQRQPNGKGQGQQMEKLGHRGKKKKKEFVNDEMANFAGSLKAKKAENAFDNNKIMKNIHQILKNPEGGGDMKNRKKRTLKNKQQNNRM